MWFFFCRGIGDREDSWRIFLRRPSEHQPVCLEQVTSMNLFGDRNKTVVELNDSYGLFQLRIFSDSMIGVDWVLLQSTADLTSNSWSRRLDQRPSGAASSSNPLVVLWGNDTLSIFLFFGPFTAICSHLQTAMSLEPVGDLGHPTSIPTSAVFPTQLFMPPISAEWRHCSACKRQLWV